MIRKTKRSLIPLSIVSLSIIFVGCSTKTELDENLIVLDAKVPEKGLVIKYSNENNVINYGYNISIDCKDGQEVLNKTNANFIQYLKPSASKNDDLRAYACIDNGSVSLKYSYFNKNMEQDNGAKIEKNNVLNGDLKLGLSDSANIKEAGFDGALIISWYGPFKDSKHMDYVNNDKGFSESNKSVNQVDKSSTLRHTPKELLKEASNNAQELLDKKTKPEVVVETESPEILKLKAELAALDKEIAAANAPANAPATAPVLVEVEKPMIKITPETPIIRILPKTEVKENVIVNNVDKTSDENNWIISEDEVMNDGIEKDDSYIKREIVSPDSNFMIEENDFDESEEIVKEIKKPSQEISKSKIEELESDELSFEDF